VRQQAAFTILWCKSATILAHLVEQAGYALFHVRLYII
jgi:hypothetical protein